MPFTTAAKTICLFLQNCHELEKMDLEECILVRVCGFFVYTQHHTPDIYLCWIWNNSWLWSVYLRLECRKKADVIVCRAGCVSCQEGEWLQYLSCFWQKAESQTEKKWHRSCNIFSVIQNEWTWILSLHTDNWRSQLPLDKWEQYVNKACPPLRWQIIPWFSCLSTALACKHW